MNEDTDQDSLPSGWTKIELAGHPCHLYEPPEPSEHNYTVLYLHGRYQGTPAEHPTMMGPFADNGLRIMAPLTSAEAGGQTAFVRTSIPKSQRNSTCSSTSSLTSRSSGIANRLD